MKYTSMVFAAVIACSGSAVAEPTWTGIEDVLMVVDPLGMTVDELVNAPILTEDGEQVGQTERVLMDSESDALAITLDVGDFLGVGEKDVLIPAERLTAKAEGVTLEMTKKELEALPEFEG